MVLLLAVSLPLGAFAQGGMLQRGSSDGRIDHGTGLFRNGETSVTLTNETFGNHVQGDNITNETFGAPLTSGALILLAASAGYATIKTRKRNKKN